MWECVINISEGRAGDLLTAIAAAAGQALLDIHADPHHHRAVLTLGGDIDQVWDGATDVTRAAVEGLDLRSHAGVHPRFGVVDVVPWVDLDGPDDGPSPAAIHQRDRFAAWAAAELGVPCFVYGPERTLPEVRRDAWRTLRPTTGPDHPHPSAGAIAVGARPVLVAFNVWLQTADVEVARRVAAAVRGRGLRTLGLLVGERAQVACNLVTPHELGPAAAFDAIAAETAVAGAELVGLVPEAVLRAIPSDRWAELDLSPDRTIEAHLPAPPRS